MRLERNFPENEYDFCSRREPDLLPYKSPFEKLNLDQWWLDDKPNHMAFKGPVSRLIDELEYGFKNNVLYNSPNEFALHPPRIIRAAIDWKIAHPDISAEEYVDQAINVGLAIYQRRPTAFHLLTEFGNRLAIEKPELLQSEVEQIQDTVTWNATQPKYSYQTAETLITQTGGSDILFIAIGHGGTAAGMDVYSKYLLNTDSDSGFYVVRYSRAKKADTVPRLTEGEVQKLHKQAKDRQVVIFDEDISTGITLRNMQSELQFSIFPGKKILSITNLD